jgi:hypothetical protein
VDRDRPGHVDKLTTYHLELGFSVLEIVIFIKSRLMEIERLTRSLSASTSIDIQAGVDQMDRLRESTLLTVEFIQYHENSPLGMPLLKKIARNWSYHKDFNPNWKV